MSKQMFGSDWILMSCQPHMVILGRTNTVISQNTAKAPLTYFKTVSKSDLQTQSKLITVQFHDRLGRFRRAPLLCERPLQAVLVWTEMSIVFRCPSSTYSADRGIDPLPLSRALKDGFGEAVLARDMPEPCEFPSLDRCQKTLL